MLTPAPGEDATTSQPGRRVADVDLRALFAGLETAGAIVLAVSGGPDSMALLMLACRWTSQLGTTAPRLYVATVDHGLRPESAEEAAFVARAAREADLPHAILAWAAAKPTTRMQERARAARYDLLSQYAKSVGATHILTAHHADDQAETVLLRLTRGSGLSGLAGMRRDTRLASGLRLVRPLLPLTKTDLIGVCRHEGQAYVEDPSNKNPFYARARLRAQSDVLATLGLDRMALLRLARRLARAEAALEADTDRWENILEPSREVGAYRADLARLRRAEPEIWLRILHRAIASVGGGDRIVRLDRLEALTESMREAVTRARAHRATLAGTRVVIGRDAILVIEREGARRRGLAKPR